VSCRVEEKMKIAAALSVVIAFLAACGPNQRILQSAASPTPEVNLTPAISSFDQEVEAMRTANFNFIYVFRRSDRAVMDADDKKFASERIPSEMNRRKLIDEGKAIIIGSNFRMPDENLTMLKEKFTLDDFSRPESEIMNGNTTAAK